jgi:predicted nucleic acid-binding protein
LILDACAVINLYSTRVMDRILATNDGTYAICDVVGDEAQYVRRGGAGDDAGDLERIDLEPLMRGGLLTMLYASTDYESDTFIDLVASGLDDGEAMSGAIAFHREGTVVTDDRTATSRLREVGVDTMPALQLVKVWAEGEHVTGAMISGVLGCIRDRARYVSPKSHPFRTWWESALQQPS